MGHRLQTYLIALRKRKSQQPLESRTQPFFFRLTWKFRDPERGKSDGFQSTAGHWNVICGGSIAHLPNDIQQLIQPHYGGSIQAKSRFALLASRMLTYQPVGHSCKQTHKATESAFEILQASNEPLGTLKYIDIRAQNNNAVCDGKRPPTDTSGANKKIIKTNYDVPRQDD
jgi:hypothetical protein